MVGGGEGGEGDEGSRTPIRAIIPGPASKSRTPPWPGDQPGEQGGPSVLGVSRRTRGVVRGPGSSGKGGREINLGP